MTIALIIVGVVVVLVLIVVALMLPEIKRYLKMRRM